MAFEKDNKSLRKMVLQTNYRKRVLDEEKRILIERLRQLEKRRKEQQQLLDERRNGLQKAQ